ncbi:MAG: hypothetical protein MO846_05195 [Candidatus Devosia symbiotica]|nr:hypothetical protein [Candidatus Devosia symbiotica]
MAAFEAAIVGNFTIKCDVQLTTDGVPIVFHDETMERLLGLPDAIADAPSTQVISTALLGSAAGDRPQCFTDFLSQIAGCALFQIELK